MALLTVAPPPRRYAAFPLPLWRGVNSLANYVSLPSPAGAGVFIWVLENRARRPCSTMVSLANHSRTVVSVPRPPTTQKSI